MWPCRPLKSRQKRLGLRWWYDVDVDEVDMCSGSFSWMEPLSRRTPPLSSPAIKDLDDQDGQCGCHPAAAMPFWCMLSSQEGDT
jgi:hypothetical protein